MIHEVYVEGGRCGLENSDFAWIYESMTISRKQQFSHKLIWPTTLWAIEMGHL